MKQFLAVFIGSKTGSAAQRWSALDEATRKEREKRGMQGWMDWFTKNQSSIVVHGSPLGKTRQVDAKGISDTKNLLCAYTIVQAESHEAAAKLFLEHPHFMIFPGDSVEIIECLPVPTI